jgi:fructosamine-3-kinase
MTDVRRERRDGVAVVVKHAGYDLRGEAAGLAALGAAGAHVPRVVAASADELVLVEVVGDGDWAALGERLALVHGTTADTFGWRSDGVIGPLPMVNTPDTDWPRFYATHRLLPWIEHLPSSLGRRLRRALEDGRLHDLVDHDVTPSLVHGDLWSGNVVGGQWLVDPAVHHADRELDLAMARLFGGFPSAFWSGYEAAAPLDAGWERRLPALQLFHLLVHVRLFGAGYVPAVAERLGTLGW